MKKILMILFFVSVSMFSFGQLTMNVNNSFGDTYHVTCYAKADYDMINSNMIIKSKENTDCFTSILFYAPDNEFRYNIGGKTFIAENAKVTKKTYNNGIVEYIVMYEVVKTSNNHHFDIPWTFRFRITPDNDMMIIAINYINFDEYVKYK